jgi:hypothetical protein
VGALIDIDELILREQQAMRRTELVHDVLAPSVQRLEELRWSLRMAHSELSVFLAERSYEEQGDRS